MDISRRMAQVIPAPIDRINRARLKLEAAGYSIYNLGQAVPDYGPPPQAVEMLRSELGEAELHLYTPDPGLPQLREMLAGRLRSKYSAGAEAERIIISGGANHAFLLASTVLFDHGDKVGLLSPYYLNHHMTLTGMGVKPVEIAPEADFRYDPQKIEAAAKDHQFKGLVLVNPSNPSGKVYSKDELQSIYEICRRNNIWLIADEVYASFVFGAVQMTSLLSIAGAAEHCIAIGSFSKEYGITGWRIGYLHAPQQLTENLLKVQDYSLICAPRAGQRLALHCMSTAPDWSDRFTAQYDIRRRLVLTLLEESRLFEIYQGAGGYFVWFRPKKEINSEKAVIDIMEKCGVCLVPGFIFGELWRSWLRLSFGNQTEEILHAACKKVAGYFGTT